MWDHSSNLSKADSALHPFAVDEGSCNPAHWALSEARPLKCSKSAVLAFQALQLSSVLCTGITHASVPENSCKALSAWFLSPPLWGHWQATASRFVGYAQNHAGWEVRSCAIVEQRFILLPLPSTHPARVNLLMFRSTFYCQSPHLGCSLLIRR